MNDGGPFSASLADAEAVVRENVSGDVDGDQHEQGKQRLLAALRVRRAGRARPLRRLALVTVALGALGGGGAYVWQRQRGARLTYDVAGGQLSDSGYVSGSGPNGARLSFSDGSRVNLHEGARARIAAVDAHGGRLAIESGHVSLNLARLPHAAWSLDAGPFVIQVAGTQLDVDWSSADDTLSVDVHEGSLVVSGPPSPAGVLVRAGQRLTAHEYGLAIEAMEQAEQASATRPTLVDPLPPDPAALNVDIPHSP